MRTLLKRIGVPPLSQLRACRVQPHRARPLWLGTLLALACLAVAPGPCLAQALTSLVQPDVVGPNCRIWSFGAAGPGQRTGAAPIAALETGMNYYDSPSQQWLPSEPVFEPGAGGQGFVAQRVQHRLRLNSQLNTVGAVSLRMDGLALDSTPIGLALYDPFSGNMAIIATLTNSTALQVSSNQVVYPDVFGGDASGVYCNFAYIVGKGTLGQDCTVTCRLDPADWGFSTNCWVQIITEF